MESPLLARSRSLAASVATAAMAVALLAHPGSANADPQVAPTSAQATSQAEQALERATAAVDGATPGRDTTLDLLDLALAQADLPAARRAAADRILARPTDGAADPSGFGYEPTANPTQSCQGGFCVHWARATDDAPSLVDKNGNGRPDYVDQVFSILVKVSGTYRQAGYRDPVSDGLLGGGGAGLFDVYLVDSGSEGVYGYCAPEDVTGTRRSAQAYCALDNNYSEFPLNTPLENLQVTVAHEYFHAVQFAYDIFEDRWFLESTAAWVEDEMYDAVDDNLQYLNASPISQPHLPLDKGSGIRVYGSWIFFRYLSEIEPAAQAGLPTIIRDILRRAAGKASSLQAIKAVLIDRKRSLTTTVARFSDANRHPARAYDEGAHYPAARPAKTATLDLGRGLRGAMRLDHLASGTLRLKPGARTTAKATRLKVRVDLPSKAVPTAAVVSVRKSSGAIKTKLVKLDKTGAGVLRVPFSSRSVTYVDVTLVNASDRFRCGQGTVYSCQGKALDNGKRLGVEVRAQR